MRTGGDTGLGAALTNQVSQQTCGNMHESPQRPRPSTGLRNAAWLSRHFSFPAPRSTSPAADTNRKIHREGSSGKLPE